MHVLVPTVGLRPRAERRARDERRDRMIVGVLLAGGASKRMGRDKASVVVEGVSLGERALRSLEAACDRVVIVGHGRGVPRRGEQIIDEGKGPAAALRTAVEATAADAFVVLPVDMPRVNEAHLRLLLEAIGDWRAACFAGAPLPLILKAGPLPNEERLLKLVDALDPLRVPPPDPAILKNVNRPEDLP